MRDDGRFEIFLSAPPGLEPVLLAEVRGKGFNSPRIVPGGVTIRGGWPEVWRANLWVRGAGRVLARIASFRAERLEELEKRARGVGWKDLLRPDRPFRVEATCRRSRIYHSDAAAERVGNAIRETLGARMSADAAIVVRARIEDDACELSLDSSGELLHKRGYKEAVGKAPIRETMAALFLMQCGFTGTEPVVDPMCGAGTFVIEAAEIACRLNPGRARHFAFEHFAGFDAGAWQRMREVKSARPPAARCHGFDRDAGAIDAAMQNAARAGVADGTAFRRAAISEAAPPEGPPGLVVVNPPYGERIGGDKDLIPLYGSLGQVLRTRFAGWRVGLVTSEPTLAEATGLPFLPTTAPVPHGGLRVTLYRTAPLA
ncbi:MAG: THUMP domain-containing protein [Hyphomicrobiaceae bacterium]